MRSAAIPRGTMNGFCRATITRGGGGGRRGTVGHSRRTFKRAMIEGAVTAYAHRPTIVIAFSLLPVVLFCVHDRPLDDKSLMAWYGGSLRGSVTYSLAVNTSASPFVMLVICAKSRSR